MTKLTPPSFKKDAVPDIRGWRHPRTGELLVARKITQEQVDAYKAGRNEVAPAVVKAAPVVAPTPEPAPTAEVVETPAPTAEPAAVDDGLESLTFVQIKSVAAGEEIIVAGTTKEEVIAEIRAARNK